MDFKTDGISIKKIEIKKPIVKDGTWQIEQETIEFTNDEQEETK